MLKDRQNISKNMDNALQKRCHYARVVALTILASLILVMGVTWKSATFARKQASAGRELPAIVSEDQLSVAQTSVSTFLNRRGISRGNSTFAPKQQAEAVQTRVSVITSKPSLPWGLAFLPDGRALVSERNNDRILMVDKEGNMREIQNIPEGGIGTGGVLGVAVSPNYEEDEFIYVYYTSYHDNRVVRFREGGKLIPIITDIPRAESHHGGALTFGPDGKLYIGTGDAMNGENAQNLQTLAGKILRINPDGSIPEDNPFEDSPIYSYGHRNVQGLAWNGEDQLYATDIGENDHDEINRIVEGGNYGWPEVEGKGDDQRYRNPVITFHPSEAGPSGATFLVDGSIPQWEGDFFFAGLRCKCIWRLEIDDDGTVIERERLLVEKYGRLRNVQQAPDGSLWALTSNHDGRHPPVPDDDYILRISVNSTR